MLCHILIPLLEVTALIKQITMKDTIFILLETLNYRSGLVKVMTAQNATCSVSY